MTNKTFAKEDEIFIRAVAYLDMKAGHSTGLATSRQASKYRRKTGRVYRASRTQNFQQWTPLPASRICP